MGAIVQQKKQNIKKFRQLRTLATFHQFGLQICVTVSISSTCNSNGISLFSIVDEKNVPCVFYHPGNVFHAIGIQNIQS